MAGLGNCLQSGYFKEHVPKSGIEIVFMKIPARAYSTFGCLVMTAIEG